jgi:hypothetical protein
MSYDVQFSGKFLLNKPLDYNTYEFLKKLAETRRVKRKVLPVYGIEGEFYVEDDYSSSIIDRENPPITQPSLYCQWIPSTDHRYIKWDGKENFSEAIEWIEYIISKVLAPRNYILNGIVNWQGVNLIIEVHDNVVNGKRLITDYSINNLLGKISSAGITISRGIGIWNREITPLLTKEAVTKAITSNNRKKKEIQKAQIAILQAQVDSLEKELKKEKTKKETPPKKELSVKDTILENIRKKIEFGGNLEDFKKMLLNLIS